MSETTDLLTYLKAIDGLTADTFSSLSNYGFDSSVTLMAMDVNQDLPQMVKISLGQRALLKTTIRAFRASNPSDKNEMNGSDEELSCDENRCQNRRIITKLKEVIHFEENEVVDQLKDKLKKTKLALNRLKNDLSKAQSEGMAKDIDNKKLNSEIFRLRNRLNDKSYESLNRKLEKTLKEREIKIKENDKTIASLMSKNSSITKSFSDWNENCFKDLNRLKAYLSAESMAIHRQVELNGDEWPQIDFKCDSEEPKIKVNDNCDENILNFEPKSCSSTQPLSKEVPEEVGREQSEEEVPNGCDYTLFEDSLAESQDTSSQVIVSKDFSFHYITPPDSQLNNEITITESNNCVPVITESVSKSGRNRRLSQLSQKLGNDFVTEVPKKIGRKRNKSCLENSVKTYTKKAKTSEEATPEGEDTTPERTLVLFSSETTEKSTNDSEKERLRKDSITLSSITALKLVSIDISSETDTEDANPVPILKQKVVSAPNVSQIATSNGYLSERNEENLSIFVNAVTPTVPIISNGVSTRSSSTPTVKNRIEGFKCVLPECDFASNYKNVFEDHIQKHVTFHFGQEIPEDWKVISKFDEYKNYIKEPKCSS